LRRRARLQRVEEQVRRNVVVGFFDTVYWARRFRRIVDAKKNARMEGVPQFAVPEIFVDDEDERNSFDSRRVSPIDMTDDPWSHIPTHGGPSRPSFGRSRNNSTASAALSFSLSPGLSPQRGPSLSVGDYSDDPLYLDGGSDHGRGSAHSRQASNVSAQDVLEVFEESPWGDSIRRSFTSRRPGGKGAEGGSPSRGREGSR
jgi:voltage-dependent calcium channel